jgi:hypothetical protein
MHLLSVHTLSATVAAETAHTTAAASDDAHHNRHNNQDGQDREDDDQPCRWHTYAIVIGIKDAVILDPAVPRRALVIMLAGYEGAFVIFIQIEIASECALCGECQKNDGQYKALFH